MTHLESDIATPTPKAAAQTAAAAPQKVARRGRPRKTKKQQVVRYTLADLERPSVTAEARLLDLDQDTLIQEAAKADIRFKESLPHFILMANLLQASINEYKSDPTTNAMEIDFWRSAVGHYYGEMFCEFARLIFNIDVGLEGLRDAAESEMGLPQGTLCPRQPHLEEKAARIALQFSGIARHHGHLHDPAADAFFEVGRRPSKKR